MGDVVVDRYGTEDRLAVRGVVLAGLEERWGDLDLTLNPDVDDLGAAYVDGTVVVARLGDAVVGCGVIVPAGPGEAEVKRMSVAVSTVATESHPRCCAP